MDTRTYRDPQRRTMEFPVLSWDEAETLFPLCSAEWDTRDRNLANPVLVIDNDILRAYGWECTHNQRCSCWWWSRSMVCWVSRGPNLSLFVAGAAIVVRPDPSVGEHEVIVVEAGKGDYFTPGEKVRLSR
jgi:hypothetical protein